MSNEPIVLYGHKISFFQKTVYSQNGSLYQYLIGRTRIDDPKHPGKKMQKDFPGKDIEEVVSKAYMFFRQEETNPSLPADPVPFDEWAERCFGIMYRYQEPTTIRSWRQAHTKLVKELGSILLPAITAERFQQAFDHFYFDQGLYPTTIHKLHSLLNRYMKAAVTEGQIGANPAEHLSLPEKHIEHNDILTTEQIESLFRECANDRYGNAILLTLLCAFRRGEILGLCEDAVHEESGSIVISQQYRHETKSIANTKTHKTHTIYPPAIAFDIIKRQIRIRDYWKEENPELWENEHNLICTMPTGGPIGRSTLERHFKKIVAAIGRPELHLHDLRRSSASVALYLSNNPKAVQNLLGQDSLGMTFYYCAVTKEQMNEFASVQNDYYTNLFRNSCPSMFKEA